MQAYSSSIKEQTENLLRAYVSVTEGSNSRILVETIQKFIKNQSKNMVEYESVIFYDIPITERIYSTFYDEKKTIVVFLNSRDSVAPDLPVELRAENVVFSYSLKSAVYDGIITPAMGNGILEYAIENYLEHLIEQFGYNRVKFNDNLQNQGWDLVTQKGDSKMWVECKYLKKLGENEKAISQFRIAKKIMDAFSEDFVENKWFNSTVYEYTSDRRDEVEKLLNE